MAPQPYLFAFLSFGSLMMGAWGLAAAAPIIIHLWNRRTHHEVRWAAMEYLLAAIRKNARRIRIEQLLLLAVRTLILLLFALALTDLSCSRSASLTTNLPGSSRGHTVLVIDGSFSMAAQDAKGSHFEQAKQLAVSLVSQSRQGDGFTLVLMGEPPRTIIGDPAFDPADVTEEILNLSVLHEGADLEATLAEVQRIVTKAIRLQPRLQHAQVCFITDLGATTWELASVPTVHQQVEQLAADATLVMLDVGQPNNDNLAVTDLRSAERFATIGRDVAFEVDIRNFGDEPSAACSLQVLVDEEPIHEETFQVDAGEQVSLGCSHIFRSPGEHVVEVRVLDDRLDVDNHRWLSIPVREEIRALCVSGGPDAARFIDLALAPDESELQRIRSEVVPETALMELDLITYDAVFLCNVGRFAREEAALLNDYLHAGGGVILFLGDQVVADSYNRELGGEASGIQILPARLVEPSELGQYAFDPLDYRHSLVRPFQGNEGAGLLTTPIWKYFRLAPLEGESGQLALAFRNGDPAIVEHQVGRGRCVLVATAGSTSSVDRSTVPPSPWTAISSWHSFPPLVHEMLSLAISRRYQNRTVNVGESFVFDVASHAANEDVRVIDPRGGSERVPRVIDGNGGSWSYGPAALSGVYQVQFDQPVSSRQSYVANVRLKESDLTRFDPEVLPQEFRREAQSDSSRPQLAGVGSRWPLFRYLLGAVLLLLLTDTILAWRFGSSLA